MAFGSGGFAAGGGAEEFDLEEPGDGHHGDAAVFYLGFAEPVEIDSYVVDVGEAEGVEAYVSGHGSVELNYVTMERRHEK